MFGYLSNTIRLEKIFFSLTNISFEIIIINIFNIIAWLIIIIEKTYFGYINPGIR